jgi:hypothetical protein
MFQSTHTHLRQGDILTNAKLTEFVNDPKNAKTFLIVKIADRCKAKWFCHRSDEKKAGLFKQQCVFESVTLALSR